MMAGLDGLIFVLGVIFFFKGLESINPKVARAFLKRKLEQPDYFFTASGLAFAIVGITIMYLGLT